MPVPTRIALIPDLKRYHSTLYVPPLFDVTVIDSVAVPAVEVYEAPGPVINAAGFTVRSAGVLVTEIAPVEEMTHW